jgi:hypothetical protein
MVFSQRVTKRDKKDRITSSYQRVRIAVPDGVLPILPAPYTGHKTGRSSPQLLELLRAWWREGGDARTSMRAHLP